MLLKLNWTLLSNCNSQIALLFWLTVNADTLIDLV